jgi:hypothetical protein
VAFLILAIGLTVLGSLVVWFSAHRPVRRRRRGAVSDYQVGLRALQQRAPARFDPPSAVVRIEPDRPVSQER